MKNTNIDAVFHLIGGTLRGWRGTMPISRARKKPEQFLKLYDIETSPFCRLVREVLCEMELDVLILPCPKGGARFRPEAKGLLPKVTFPMLVDENTGTTLIESQDIIDYLGETYEAKVKNAHGALRGLSVATSVLSSLMNVRLSGIEGVSASPSKAPEQPLELYSFESSPYSKSVRARLCELEIPYILRNTPKAVLTDMGPPALRDKVFKAPKGTSAPRQWLLERTGKVQVPYLIDPNTGVEMYESARIIDYLNQTYGA